MASDHSRIASTVVHRAATSGPWLFQTSIGVVQRQIPALYLNRLEPGETLEMMMVDLAHPRHYEYSNCILLFAPAALKYRNATNFVL